MAKRVPKSLAPSRSTPGILDSVHSDSSSLGAQYKEVLATALADLSRHKLLILVAVTVALALGILATLMAPKRYTAEAYVRGGFAASDAVAATSHSGTSEPVVALDAALVVETRARLFQFHQLAREVVKNLGLEKLSPELGGGGLSSWLQARFYGDAVNAPGYQEDLAAAKLSRGLSVTTEPRVYQIVLHYTAGDPELAAEITNAFVAEFLRMTALQRLSEQRASAQAKLSTNLATLGGKHPKVLEARMRLASTDSLVKQQFARSQDEMLKGAGENITLAQANVVPSSPKPLVFIGVALLIGLAAGIGFALWLERAPEATDAQDSKRPIPFRRTAARAFANSD